MTSCRAGLAFFLVYFLGLINLNLAEAFSNIRSDNVGVSTSSESGIFLTLWAARGVKCFFFVGLTLVAKLSKGIGDKTLEVTSKGEWVPPREHVGCLADVEHQAIFLLSR
jgi:hypothetical protein